MNNATKRSPYRRIRQRPRKTKVFFLWRIHSKVLAFIRNVLRCVQGSKSCRQKSKANCKISKSSNCVYYVETESLFYKVAIEDCLEFIRQSHQHHSSHGNISNQ